MELQKNTTTDSNRTIKGNLVVINTEKKISNTGTVETLSSAQDQDCSSILGKLPKQWDKMFMDKNRIEGDAGLMRLDQQNFFNEDIITYSNTAIQNNTAQGSRDRKHTHTYAAVAIDCNASKQPNIADAMMYAYDQSLTKGTFFKIDVQVTAPVQVKVAKPMIITGPTAVFKCSRCGNALTLPVDLIDRGRVLNSYPPDHTCPRCGKAQLTQQK
jgi:hypothetical protein